MSVQIKSSSFASLRTAHGGLAVDQWLAWLQPRAPQIVMGVAVLALAWQAAQLTWLIWGLIKPAQAVAPISAPAAPSPGSTRVNPQTIANAHLFGAPDMGNAADPNSLPQAQVNLVLSGTMALADPSAGFAIIGDSAVNAKFFRVGATINGVARLHSVYTDRVVIERNGTLETLVLPKGQPGMAAPPVAHGLTPMPANFNDNLRRLANNPDLLNNLLRAQPVFANGTFKGFRIYPGRDRQQFVKMGLQPGDLVTTVNGTALDDPNRANEILNTIASSTNAVVVVERNGTQQQINLDMTQLSIPDASGNNPAADNHSGTPRPNAPGFGTPGLGPAPASPPSAL